MVAPLLGILGAGLLGGGKLAARAYSQDWLSQQEAQRAQELAQQQGTSIQSILSDPRSQNPMELAGMFGAAGMPGVATDIIGKNITGQQAMERIEAQQTGADARAAFARDMQREGWDREDARLSRKLAVDAMKLKGPLYTPAETKQITEAFQARQTGFAALDSIQGARGYLKNANNAQQALGGPEGRFYQQRLTLNILPMLQQRFQAGAMQKEELALFQKLSGDLSSSWDERTLASLDTVEEMIANDMRAQLQTWAPHFSSLGLSDSYVPQAYRSAQEQGITILPSGVTREEASGTPPDKRRR